MVLVTVPEPIPSISLPPPAVTDPQSYLGEGELLIPKPKLMPRSISTPRSQPMSSYLLYSSLVFHCSQVPISVTTKCLAQPRFLSILHSWLRHSSLPAGHVSVLKTVMRRLHSTFWPYVPWRLKVKYIGRIILHQQSPFNSYPFFSPIPVSTSLTLTIPVYLTLPSSDYYSSVISLV